MAFIDAFQVSQPLSYVSNHVAYLIWRELLLSGPSDAAVVGYGGR